MNVIVYGFMYKFTTLVCYHDSERVPGESCWESRLPAFDLSASPIAWEDQLDETKTKVSCRTNETQGSSAGYQSFILQEKLCSLGITRIIFIWKFFNVSTENAVFCGSPFCHNAGLKPWTILVWPFCCWLVWNISFIFSNSALFFVELTQTKAVYWSLPPD